MLRKKHEGGNVYTSYDRGFPIGFKASYDNVSMIVFFEFTFSSFVTLGQDSLKIGMSSELIFSLSE